MSIKSGHITYSKNWKDVSVGEGTNYNDILEPGIGGQISDFQTKKQNVGIFKQTMSQSSYFKVTISKLPNPKMSAVPYGNFLPVKSVNYNPVSIESTNITAGIFSELSFITHKKVGKISIELLDTNDCYYEKLLKRWYDNSVPHGGYVGYLTDKVATFTYTSFSTSGKVMASNSFYVILDGEYSTTRDYDSNALKQLNFSLTIVGTIS